MTIALAGLAAYCVLRSPVLGNVWINEALDAALSVRNLADLCGDLCGLLALCALVIHAANAWGKPELNGFIAHAGIAVAAFVTLAFVKAGGASADISYIGHLGGWAEAYSYVAAVAILIANVVIFGSVILAHESKDRVWLTVLLPLGAGSLCGIFVGAYRATEYLHADMFASSQDAVVWPLSALTTFLYAVAAHGNYRIKTTEPMPERERV
ncbi:hypothetical protein [Antrihabitans cavernicola]|uniref:DUF998 domain-containing protein n=1 Tax=Antrihabitans cavernicola TaxID=2495913 RepID=A0A5A7S8N3_9NOCA|nr:hypothetical protein [Spelaeibacter cavernicola]KAA0021834.1 hypothetical protein FOY51_15670 [Spelaeibacter cavernicola]